MVASWVSALTLTVNWVRQLVPLPDLFASPLTFLSTGLGTSLSYPCIPTPTEIPLTRCYNKATRVVCDRVAAGGNLTYFIVEREEIGTGRKAFDLLAANLRPSSGVRTLRN